jgi:hypothetical protein
VDVAGKLLGCLYIAADIVKDLIEDSSIIVTLSSTWCMISRLLVPRPSRKILLSLIALVESARIERICAMIFASNSGVSGIAV